MTPGGGLDGRVLISLADVCKVLSVSRWTLRRMTRSGSFPEPVTLPTGAVRWDAGEVASWIEARKAVTRA